MKNFVKEFLKKYFEIAQVQLAHALVLMTMAVILLAISHMVAWDKELKAGACQSERIIILDRSGFRFTYDLEGSLTEPLNLCKGVSPSR